MEHRGSLPHSQVPATCPYHGADRFIPCPTSHFLKTHLVITLPSTPGSTKWPLSSGFCTKRCKHLFRIRAMCPAHLIHFYFSTQTTLDEDYISLSYSLTNFLHSPVTSSLLPPNIPLNTLF